MLKRRRHCGLDPFDTLIDVRSESEFAEDHVPGAINCPVLSDAERKEVGTMDRQQSSFEARRRGAALVARNIARHLETQFADRPRDWRPLVYCWRGGNRSGAMTHVLGKRRLARGAFGGGHRAYRRAVIEQLEALPGGLQFRVICGATGSGKSRLLQQLALRVRRCWTSRPSPATGAPCWVDCPRSPSLARSSSSFLWDRLRRFNAALPVFVESESRKVGSLRVPDALLARMRESPCIRLEVPRDVRVRLLRDEYSHFELDPDTLMTQLDCLVELHGHERISQWKSLAHDRSWDGMVEQLLLEHYDPGVCQVDRSQFQARWRSARVAGLVRDGSRLRRRGA